MPRPLIPFLLSLLSLVFVQSSKRGYRNPSWVLITPEVSSYSWTVVLQINGREVC